MNLLIKAFTKAIERCVWQHRADSDQIECDEIFNFANVPKNKFLCRIWLPTKQKKNLCSEQKCLFYEWNNWIKCFRKKQTTSTAEEMEKKHAKQRNCASKTSKKCHQTIVFHKIFIMCNDIAMNNVARVYSSQVREQRMFFAVIFSSAQTIFVVSPASIKSLENVKWA